VELVVSLKEPFERSGNRAEWLTTVEQILPKYPYELIWLYAESCLATNSSSRLLEHAEALGALTSAKAEARRQIAIGRARLLNHDLSGALTASARARALASSDVSVLDYAGQIAMAAGNASDAEACFREALHILALATGKESDRGRLYRQHGQALESLGQLDEAFAAYRRARELSMDDPWLEERFADSWRSSSGGETP
jgi:tetratricopeptide (TPR) repeat protein